MQYAFAPLALAALAAAAPAPQAASSGECASSYPGTFQIQVVNITSPTKRSAFVEKRQSTALQLTLADGILLDSQQRVGNIVANDQFQFDPAPGQAGAKFVDGWSVCSNGSLAIQGDSTFYQCLSGTFYNLYDEAEAEQCSPVHIQVINGSGGSSTGSGSSPAQQIPDGQVTGSPAQEMPDGQITAVPVSQIADGQIQEATGSPVQQIGDGQVQQPTGSPVQQIGDGQVQAPTGAPVSQIADGQVQAGNATAAPSAPAQYTGAATAVRAEFFAAAAGVLAMAML